jgi:hypothetical protein
MRSAEEFKAVQRLIAAGVSDGKITRQTDIPRCTVRDWRCRPQVRSRGSRGSPCAHDFSRLPAKSYSYLLGLYLGDGCISRGGRVWRLRITLDSRYPKIIDRTFEAIEILMPGQRAGTWRRSDNCGGFYLYSKHWPCLFPQHGPGKKH